jgi:hypothetical protein
VDHTEDINVRDGQASRPACGERSVEEICENLPVKISLRLAPLGLPTTPSCARYLAGVLRALIDVPESSLDWI